jgi:hypothetical protein
MCKETKLPCPESPCRLQCIGRPKHHERDAPSRSVSSPVSRSVPVRNFLIRISQLRMNASFLSLLIRKHSAQACEIMITFTGQGLRGPHPGASRDGRWVYPFPEPTCWLDRSSVCILTRTQHRHGRPCPAPPPFLCRLAMICTTDSVARPLLVPFELKVPAKV